jgi:hypothetical protein
MNNNITHSLKEEKQIQKLITKLKYPTKEIDEYSIFNNALQNLNIFNNQILTDFIAMLNDPQKYMWNELIHTRRINISHSGIKMDVPRRTVKIKRADNN